VLPIPVWDRFEDVCSMDPLRFRAAHRDQLSHQQRLREVRGLYHSEDHFREAAETQKRESNMRSSRIRNQEESSIESRRENVRLVERLCSVLRESETRQKQLQSSPLVPTEAVARGTLNISRRRNVAAQIDKENRRFLDRLIRAAPGIATRSQLASRYQMHQKLVAQHSRLRRRWDSDKETPPHQPHPPNTVGPGPSRPSPHGRKVQQPPPQQANNARGGGKHGSNGSADTSVGGTMEEELVRAAACNEVKRGVKTVFKRLYGASPPDSRTGSKGGFSGGRRTPGFCSPGGERPSSALGERPSSALGDRPCFPHGDRPSTSHGGIHTALPGPVQGARPESRLATQSPSARKDGGGDSGEDDEQYSEAGNDGGGDSGEDDEQYSEAGNDGRQDDEQYSEAFPAAAQEDNYSDADESWEAYSDDYKEDFAEPSGGSPEPQDDDEEEEEAEEEKEEEEKNKVAVAREEASPSDSIAITDEDDYNDSVFEEDQD